MTRSRLILAFAVCASGQIAVTADDGKDVTEDFSLLQFRELSVSPPPTWPKECCKRCKSKACLKTQEDCRKRQPGGRCPPRRDPRPDHIDYPMAPPNKVNLPPYNIEYPAPNRIDDKGDGKGKGKGKWKDPRPDHIDYPMAPPNHIDYPMAPPNHIDYPMAPPNHIDYPMAPPNHIDYPMAPPNQDKGDGKGKGKGDGKGKGKGDGKGKGVQLREMSVSPPPTWPKECCKRCKSEACLKTQQDCRKKHPGARCPPRKDPRPDHIDYPMAPPNHIDYPMAPPNHIDYPMAPPNHIDYPMAPPNRRPTTGLPNGE